MSTVKTVPFTPPFRQRPPEKPPVTIAFVIQHAHVPAFKAALDEISDKIGTRLIGPRKFSEEDALTYAAAALGALRGATYATVPGPPSAAYVW
jgi:hypothetical protein